MKNLSPTSKPILDPIASAEIAGETPAEVKLSMAMIALN